MHFHSESAYGFADPVPPVSDTVETVTDLDEQLMSRIAAGEEAAVGEVYRRYFSPLIGIAYRILGSRTEAEDVVQWSICRAWHQAAQFCTTRGSIGGWLATVARRRAIDVLRMREGRRRALAFFPTREWALESGSGRDGIVTSERESAVRSALAKLQPAESRAIHLAFFSELTHQQIAEKIGAPVGTVKARIRRGMRKLRPSLSGLGFVSASGRTQASLETSAASGVGDRLAGPRNQPRATANCTKSTRPWSPSFSIDRTL